MEKTRVMEMNKKQRKRMRRKVKEQVMESLTKGMAAQTIGGMAQKRPANNRKRRNRAKVPTSGGEIIVKRKELLEAVKAGALAGDVYKKFVLRPKNFTWLKTLSKAFEKYQWVSLKVMWKPAVGTTVGGLVSMGMRWEETTQDPSKREEIVAHTPNRTIAVWEDGEKMPLLIPPSRLQTRKWYLMDDDGSDGGPGQVELGVSTSEVNKLLGEVWVEYTIRMAGTQA